MDKCYDTNKDVTLALLQIGSTPSGCELLSIATGLFYRLIRGLLSKIIACQWYIIMMMSIVMSWNKQQWTDKHDIHRDFTISQYGQP